MCGDSRDSRCRFCQTAAPPRSLLPHTAPPRVASRAVRLVRCSDFHINAATCLGKKKTILLFWHPHKTTHDLEHSPEVLFHPLKRFWTFQLKTRDQTPPGRTPLNSSPERSMASLKLLFHLPSLSPPLPQTSVSAWPGSARQSARDWHHGSSF